MPGLVVDRKAPIPIYYQIQEYFTSIIAEGHLKPGDPLPSENELAASLGVGKMTVRQAMDNLVHEGLIYRQRGRGTFAAFPEFRHPLQRLVSFSEDITSRGMVPSSRMLFFGYVQADKIIAANLHVPAGKSVLRIWRLRLADGNPVGIHDSYVLLKAAADLTREELERLGSMYAVLSEHGIELTQAEESLEAVAATKEEATLLGLRPNSPLLLVSRIAHSPAGDPLEYVRAVYRSDLYRYCVHLKR